MDRFLEGRAAQIVTVLSQLAAKLPVQASADRRNILEFVDEASRVAEELIKSGKVERAYAFVSRLSHLADTAVTGLVDCLPWKWSLARLFSGIDPFKPMRLEADAIAREYGMKWRRQ